MTKSLGSIVAGLTLVLSVSAGCQKAAEQPWSTKADSIEPAPAQLAPVLAMDTMTIAAMNDAELRAAAIDLLLQAASSPSALLRHQAIEGLQNAPEHIAAVARQGLVDENRAVRFAAAMTIGQLELLNEAHLLKPLLHNESDSVRAAAIFGLKKCGIPVDLNPLATMIRSDDPEVRGNAALVLGRLGEKSAAPMIEQAIGRGMERVALSRAKVIELQMAEALVMLGRVDSIEPIRAALFAPATEQGELVALACVLCGELKDGAAVDYLENLALRSGDYKLSAEIRMAATLALAKIGGVEVPIAVPLEYVDQKEFPQIRQTAAVTLGWIARPESLAALRKLLSDESAVVQVAAAGAIVRLTTPVQVGGAQK